MMKILDIADPLLRCYPHHANIIAGLSTNDYDYASIATNYIQLVYNRDINRLDFNYGMDILTYIRNYPLVESYCYERYTVKNKWSSYSSFIFDMINENCYVHFLVDTYYVSAYKEWFKQRHFPHNITIYGYDDNWFYAADCFENGKYTIAQVSKDEINRSVLGADEYDWLYGIHCWKFKDDVFLDINISATEVKKLLRQYISGKRTDALTKFESEHRTKSYKYGLNVYNEIIRYVATEKEKLDFRIPYILVEHKISLNYICNELEKRFLIKDVDINTKNLGELKRNAIVIQNLFIKYNITRNPSLKERIINKLSENKQLEQFYLQKLYNDIISDGCFDKHYYSKKELKNAEYDIETYGNWKGKYGTKGYYIIGDKHNLPKGLKVKNYRGIYVSILKKCTDIGGLYRSSNSDRIVSYILNNKEFNILITTKDSLKISLYCIDYDRLGRAMSIQIIDCINNKLTYEEIIEHFEDGIYISFYINCDTQINFNKINGPDAVLSAIFFD